MCFYVFYIYIQNKIEVILFRNASNANVILFNKVSNFCIFLNKLLKGSFA